MSVPRKHNGWVVKETTDSGNVYEFIGTANALVSDLPTEDVGTGSLAVAQNGKRYVFHEDVGWRQITIGGGGTTPTGTLELSITQNGTTIADVSSYADAEINVDVPNTYAGGDEGKVVQNGELVSQSAQLVLSNGTYDTTTKNQVQVSVENKYTAEDQGKVVQGQRQLVAQTSTTKTANGTYDTTLNNEVVVAVPNTYEQSDEGKVVQNGALVSQSALMTVSNGTYDTTTNDEVVVNVPNTYSASDEGKVVDNGALVSQTSRSISANGTYDTTLNDEVVVEVPGNQRLLDFLAGRSDSEETKLTISDADFVNTGSTGNKKIGPYAFAGTTVEEDVELDLSRTRRIGHHAFFQMEISKGLEITADKVVSVDQSAFEGFKAGVSSGTKPTLSLPRIISQIPYACFKDCTAFSAVDLGEGCGTINAMAFNGSTISEVVIRKTESRVPLGNVSAFANWTGTIYVPDALVDDYKGATNWSTYASSIEPLSNYNP